MAKNKEDGYEEVEMEDRGGVAVAANRLPEAETDSWLGLSRNWTVLAMLLWNLVS